MADLVKIQSLKNAGAALTKNAGAVSQTIVYDRSDEKIVYVIENGDALACAVRFSTLGFGAPNAPDLEVDIAAGEFAVVGSLESMFFKDPATQKVTAEILDQDGTAFSGTAANVLITVIDLPKSLVD